MKRIIVLTAMFVSLGATLARAGEPGGDVNSAVLKETVVRNSLWRGSPSAAGLAFQPYTVFNTLDLGYNGAFGEYRKIGDGKASNEIAVSTAGAAYLGKFLVTGDFSFKNIIDKDALYNVLRYEIEDNMPFYPMDDKSSGWTRQAYELHASLTSPVLWDFVSFGVSGEYFTKVAAKQLDPRGESYSYGALIRPSVAFSFGESVLALNGLYADYYERSTPSNNNNWESPKIWQHRGLGESTQGKVGGNDGMKTIVYRTTKLGGGLQYSYADALYIGAEFIHRTTDAKENLSLPKRLGSIAENDITLDAAWLFGENKSDKLSLGGKFSLTDGIEYVQKLNTTAFQQEWMVISSNSMSTYTDVRAHLGYDHLFGAGDARGYSWKVGAEADFRIFDQSYLSPASTSNAMRAYGGVLADKQFKFRNSALLLGVNCGYAAGFGSGYVCGNGKAYATPKAAMQEQLDFLNADYIKAGGRAELSIETGTKVNWLIAARADWIGATALGKDRIAASFSFGILF